MKRFKPDSLEPVGVTRKLVFWSMEISSSSELLILVRQRVNDWCKQILQREDLTSEQSRIITMALNDIPTTVRVFSDLILDRMMDAEAKQNALFMLGKMADDLMQVGAVYVSGLRNEDVPAPITVSGIASAAGIASGLSRSRAAEEGWNTTVRRIAIAIMRDGKARSANKLATDVLAKWDGPDAHRRDPKTVREYLEGMAGELEPPFALKVDARSKKVRK